MAPRTRSGRGLNVEEVAAHRKALRAGPVNTQGFAALPPELLLEIISQLPTISFPCDTSRPLDRAYLFRPKLALALSQVCRSLRPIFLPRAYERIEVCALMDSDRTLQPYFGYIGGRISLRDKKMLATELIRQLEVVTIREPSLAQYVKIVNVRIEEHSFKTVLGELFRCLPLFPALQTVQLMGDDWVWYEYGPRLENVPQMPSVTNVVYPLLANMVLRCFPNAKHVARGFLDWTKDTILTEVTTIAKYCPNAEDIRGLENLKSSSIEPELRSMIELLPKLQVVRFGIFTDSTPLPEQIKQASRLRDLRSIVFEVQIQPDTLEFSQYLEKPDLPCIIKAAIDTLKGKSERAGCVKSVSVKHGLTEDFYVEVNQEGYICRRDDLALLPRLKELGANREQIG